MATRPVPYRTDGAQAAGGACVRRRLGLLGPHRGLVAATRPGTTARCSGAKGSEWIARGRAYGGSGGASHVGWSGAALGRGRGRAGPRAGSVLLTLFAIS
jgi:hypothetical protein